MSYFSSEHLNLLCREYNDLISKGEILPHSPEGRSLLKTAVSNVKDMNGGADTAKLYTTIIRAFRME